MPSLAEFKTVRKEIIAIGTQVHWHQSLFRQCYSQAPTVSLTGRPLSELFTDMTTFQRQKQEEPHNVIGHAHLHL